MSKKIAVAGGIDWTYRQMLVTMRRAAILVKNERTCTRVKLRRMMTFRDNKRDVVVLVSGIEITNSAGNGFERGLAGTRTMLVQSVNQRTLAELFS